MNDYKYNKLRESNSLKEIEIQGGINIWRY